MGRFRNKKVQKKVDVKSPASQVGAPERFVLLDERLARMSAKEVNQLLRVEQSDPRPFVLPKNMNDTGIITGDVLGRFGEERWEQEKLDELSHSELNENFYGNFLQGNTDFERFCDAEVHILTDWRLAHLNPAAFKNAFVKFFPTNLHKSHDFTNNHLKRYVINILEFVKNRRQRINIVFAFGGHPGFDVKCYKTFIETMSRGYARMLVPEDQIKFTWFSQDWCDGMEVDEFEFRKVDDFNTKLSDEIRQRSRSFQYFNIRDQFDIPYINGYGRKEAFRDYTELEPIYSAYAEAMVLHCGLILAPGFSIPCQNNYPNNDVFLSPSS